MVSYEEGNQLERRFAGRAEEIVTAFGPEWVMTLQYYDNGVACWATLTRIADGLPINIGVDRHHGRITCRPCVPLSETGGMMSLRDWSVIGWKDASPEATVAFDRDAGQIAREFTRKVVEPYAALYPKIIEVKTNRLATANRSKELAEAIRAKLLVMPYPKEGFPQSERLTFRNDGCEIQISRWGSIDIKFSPSPEVALAFIDWLKSQNIPA